MDRKKSWTIIVFTLHKQIGFGNFFFKFIFLEIFIIYSLIWFDEEHKNK